MTKWILALTLVLLAAGAALAGELDRLVTPAEKDFLLAELARVTPPERLRELAGFGARQSELGGGFYGMMPDQLADPDSIPVPDNNEGRLAAALCLARQREANRAALLQINPQYAVEFRGESLADFLAGLPAPEPRPGGPALDLRLDTSALTGFFAALDDGEISADEAADLAALPSNQAMLQHRRDLGYVPEPLPDTESLAEMIRMAGSSDPLDRLWCWLNSQNCFDYADIAQHPDEFQHLVSELEGDDGALEAAALDRIARFTPPEVDFAATFALTVGWAIRGWATPAMAGLNVEQVKDDWPFLLGTLIEETYHRLQLELFPTASGEPAHEFSDLAQADTGDPRFDKLHEIVFYTVAEGAANRVRGPFAAPDLADKAGAGAELLVRFVREVIDGGDLEAADALINEGLKGNGPLYGLGWTLAGAIAEAEGESAVGDWQRQGAAAFFLRGAELTGTVAPEVAATVAVLRDRKRG